MRRLKWGDVPGLILATALLSYMLYWTVEHPTWDWRRATGFGPEWQCTDSGGPDQVFATKSRQASRGRS